MSAAKKKRKSQAVNLSMLLRAAAESMWLVFNKSAASQRPDHKGLPREEEIRSFLRAKLPKRFGVAHGHIVYGGDKVSNEFDVIIYHAWDAPSWDLDSNSADPRLLVPLESVAGIVEVKSTLTSDTLDMALEKIYELDEIVRSSELKNKPFRFIFSYRTDENDDFGGWGDPTLRLCSYATPRCQPDGLFVLSNGFSVLASVKNLARSYAIQNRETLSFTLTLNADFRNDDLRRSVELDASYCNDYKNWKAKDGAVVLPFLTFVIQFCSDHSPADVDYADIFSQWDMKKPKRKSR